MIFSLNSNISTLRSRWDIYSISKERNETMERLSSGSRINKGADDPSGLGISSGMKSVFRGTNVAIENAQDASNLLKTADGAMMELRDMLLRMRDLALRASNEAVMTTADMSKLNDEFQKLYDELTRTSAATHLRTDGVAPLYWPKPGVVDVMYVFDVSGSMGGFADTAKTQLASFISNLEANNIDWAIGLEEYSDVWPHPPFPGEPTVFSDLTTDAATAQQYLNDIDIQSGFWTLAESGLEGLDEALNSASWRFPDGTTNYFRHMIMVTDVAVGNDVNHTASGDGMSLLDMAPVITDLVNGGITVHIAGDVNQPQNIAIATATGGLLGDISDFSTALNSIMNSVINVQDIQSEPERTFDIHVSPFSDSDLSFIFEDTRGFNLSDDLDGANLLTTAAALSAVTATNEAIDTLGNFQAKYGIMDRRLDFIINDLSQQNIDLQAANSRIEDADMAVEMARLTKNQILSQSALAAESYATTQMVDAARELIGQVQVI